MTKYKETKKIVIDGCQTCPFKGKCKPWLDLEKKERVFLLLGDGYPDRFILNGCPLPYGEDGDKPTFDENDSILNM